MNRIALAAVVLWAGFAGLPVRAQPASPAQAHEPVYRSGPWFVVRSVRDGGGVVACTGFYRANARVQLSKDTLAIKVPVEVRSVAFGFDGAPLPAARPLSAAERQVGAIALMGDDFARLARSRQLTIEVATAAGLQRHVLQLHGLAGALANIHAGCPSDGKRRLRRPAAGG